MQPEPPRSHAMAGMLRCLAASVISGLAGATALGLLVVLLSAV